MAKATKLPFHTAADIGRTYLKAKESGKAITMQDMAARYNCTVNQVRNAISRQRAGVFGGRRGRKRQLMPIATDTRERHDIYTSLVETFLRGIEQQYAAGEITLSEAIRQTEIVVSTEKLMQQIRLTGQLRTKDALLLAALVRYFKPNASDDEVIQVLTEVREQCKASLS